jgi:predicted MFS family arabinose efflux permease
VLPSLSNHLGIAPAAAGQLVTLFALACAVTGPLMVGLTRTWPKRRIAVTALLITGAGNAFTALAPSLAQLVTARIITAVGVAVYVPAASATAAAITAGSHRARAMAAVIGGLTVALLLGVPVTTALLSKLGGFQGVFLLIMAACLLTAAAIVMIVPAARVPLGTRTSGRLAGVSDRRVLCLLGTTFMATTGTFAVYTYITQVVQQSTVHGWPLSLMLAAYGVGAVAGNVICGQLADKWHPARLLLIATITSCTALLVLTAVAATPAALLGVLLVWGGACWAVYGPLNALLLSNQDGRTGSFLLDINASGVYAGMATGGLVGGLVITGAGIGALPPVAAATAAAAAGLVYLGALPNRKPPKSTND